MHMHWTDGRTYVEDGVGEGGQAQWGHQEREYDAKQLWSFHGVMRSSMDSSWSVLCQFDAPTAPIPSPHLLQDTYAPIINQSLTRRHSCAASLVRLGGRAGLCGILNPMRVCVVIDC